MTELTPEIIKNLTSEQVELLAELGELAKNELEITKKIDQVRKTAEKVGLNREHRDTRAVHEDPDFDELLSIRSIKEREIIRDRITGTLKSIIDAGLGELDIVKRQAANYKISLDPDE